MGRKAKCNLDCFNCVYDDCIIEGGEPEKQQIHYQRYYYAHREEILKKRRAYYQENREACIERCKKWESENKAHIAAYRKEYYEKNKDKIAKRRKNARERKKLSPEVCKTSTKVV